MPQHKETTNQQALVITSRNSKIIPYFNSALLDISKVRPCELPLMSPQIYSGHDIM